MRSFILRCCILFSCFSVLPQTVAAKEDGFTINFNNISIREYIRFVARVMNVNFVYDENDLDFTVTIVSEEPITAKNVLSALVQVLRVHDLILLEQEGNFLITKNKDVNQIPTVVSSDIPGSLKTGATPIVTRVFRLKNANPSSIAAIIRPMMSAAALIEVSLETRQLIVTDITTNVDKVFSLLASLDAPHSPLDIDRYKAKHISPDDLIALAKEIVTPFAEGNTLTFVSQIETGSIYIVSTPHLIERALSVLDDLDVSLKPGWWGLRSIGFDNIYVYKVLNKSPEELENSLKKIATDLTKAGAPPGKLVVTLEHAKAIKGTDALLLMGDQDSLTKVKDFLTNLDTQSTLVGRNTFYIYKIQRADEAQFAKSLRKLAQDLKSSGIPDKDLIDAINSLKWIEETNSLIFTGTDDAIKRLSELLPNFDVTLGQSYPASTQFLIYTPLYRDGQAISAALNEIAQNLKQTGLADPSFLHTVSTMKWLPNINTLLFTGDTTSLDRIKEILKTMDVVAGPGTAGGFREASAYLLYKPKYKTGEDLICILHDFENNLIRSNVQDSGLFDVINNLKWIEKTNSILISGDQASVAKVQELLEKFDVPSQEGGAAIGALDRTSFLIYKLNYHQGEEIQKALKQIATELQAAETVNQNLIKAISSIQWIKLTNSLLTTGDQDTLNKLRDLIQNLDVALKQVFIEVLVVETTLSNTQNFGLHWGGRLQFLNKTAAQTGNFPIDNLGTSSQVVDPSLFAPLNAVVPTAPPSSQIPANGGFDFGVIGDIIMHKGKSFLTLGSLVTALQTDSDSTVLLNPKIIAQDNNNSTIFVGQNIPFVSSLINAQAAGSAGTTTTSNVEYRDVGVNLSITPTLGNNNIITLDISNDISSQVIGGTVSFSGGSLNGLQTTHTSLNTRVHVPDRAFVALSGMINETRNHARQGLPCLGGLPVLGVLFSQTTRASTKDNIIIFLRPYIVNSFDQYREITEHQEELYKEQAVIPVLKEEFDAAVDIIKSPE